MSDYRRAHRGRTAGLLLDRSSRARAAPLSRARSLLVAEGTRDAGSERGSDAEGDAHAAAAGDGRARVGLPWLRKRKSSFLGGVGEDAMLIADRIARTETLGAA